MKKGFSFVLAALLAGGALALLAGCGGSSSGKSGETAGGDASDEFAFNPDKENGVSIEEVRATYGAAVPVSNRAINFGAVAKNFQNEYWRSLRSGYGEAQSNLSKAGFNVTVDVQGALDENDEQGQLAIVNNMINRGYDGLLLSPISDGNLVPGVESANEKGIPVLNVNDGLIAIAPYFVGPKADQNGELAAEWISRKLGGSGQVAIVIGMPKAFAARQRTEGFKRWMAANAPGIKIVAEQNADWDRNRARELAGTWIRTYPELNAIFCNNDDMALGVVEAVLESGKNILVVGVDGVAEAYDSIRRGELSATIDSFPYYKAQIAVEYGLRVLAGQNPPRVIWTPQAIIDSDNVDIPPAEIISWVPSEFVPAE